MGPVIKGTHEQQLRDALEELAPSAPYSQIREVIDRIGEIVYGAVDQSVQPGEKGEDYDELSCTLIGGDFCIRRESAI